MLTVLIAIVRIFFVVVLLTVLQTHWKVVKTTKEPLELRRSAFIVGLITFALVAFDFLRMVERHWDIPWHFF